jgi:4-hydroxy-3-polyprenylbenzoate decarboxylase
VEAVRALARATYDDRDLAAAISSGSLRTDGMAVVPSSMKTLAAIAHLFSADLLTRAAHVTTTEGLKLVLVPRETPLHLGHLRKMVLAAEIGAVVLPPVPALYHALQGIDDQIDLTVGKILDQFNLPHTLFRRWPGAPQPPEGAAQQEM